MSDFNTPSKHPEIKPNRVYSGFTIKVPIFGQIPLTPREILQDLRIKNNPPVWAQFFKYGICGVASLLLFALAVSLINRFFPAFLDNQVLSNEQFQFNLTITLLCAFIPSNFFAYFTNRMFVFTPGKHSFGKEMTIFTIISAISFAGGEVGKRFIVNSFPDNPNIVLLATLSFAVSSALINFIARKYIVFSKDTVTA